MFPFCPPHSGMIEFACDTANLPLTPDEENLEIYNPVLSVSMNVLGMSIVYGGMPLLKSGVCCLCYIQDKHNKNCVTEECDYSYQDAAISHSIKEELDYYLKSKAVMN